MYLGKYGKYFSYFYLVSFFVGILFVSEYIEIIALDSDFTNKSYWIFSSIMQTNAAIVGLFFVGFSMFLSKGLDLEKLFESTYSLLFYLNTIFLIILSILALFGMSTTADINISSNYPDIITNKEIIKKIIFLEIFGLLNTILILLNFPKLFLIKEKTEEYDVPLPKEISYLYFMGLYKKIKKFLKNPSIHFYNDDNVIGFLLSIFLNIGYNDFMGISALILFLINWLYMPLFATDTVFYVLIIFFSVLILGFILVKIFERKRIKEKYFNWILNKWGIKVKFSSRKNGIIIEKGINIVFVFRDKLGFNEKGYNNQKTLYYYFEYIGDIKIQEEFIKAFKSMVMFYQNKEFK